MLKRFRAFVRKMLTGRRLIRSIDRNTQAADDLDSLLREVMRR